jgi:hypothetical protein
LIVGAREKGCEGTVRERAVENTGMIVTQLDVFLFIHYLGFVTFKKLSPGYFTHYTCHRVCHAVTRTLKRKYLQRNDDCCKHYNANMTVLKESNNRIINMVHSSLSGGYDTEQQIHRYGQYCCENLQGVST